MNDKIEDPQRKEGNGYCWYCAHKDAKSEVCNLPHPAYDGTTCHSFKNKE